MKIAIRSMGNSGGVVIPRPLLAQIGLDESGAAEITVENGALVLRKRAAVRQGWAAAAHSGDTLLMGEFDNADDTDLADPIQP